MDSIEQRVNLYFDEIKNCVKNPTVALHLHASGIITQGQQSQLQDYYRQDKIRATEELIQFVRASQEPGKWRALIDALKEEEYPYLATLLNPSTRIEETSKREKNMIRLFLPDLGVNITAREIAPHLYSKDLIDQTDLQEILSVFDTHGNTYAAICLLERMQTRKSPKVWYYEFLSTLISTNNEAMVEAIEPDFIKNQKQFHPEYGQDREECSSANQKFTNKDDVKEHVLMDYEEASTSTNLNAPPPHLEQFALSSDSYDNDGSFSNQFNMKELVKPKVARVTITVPVIKVTAIQSTTSSMAMASNGETSECTGKCTKEVTGIHVAAVKRIPTDEELVEIAHCIEQGWEFLAAYLGVDNSIVQAIKADNLSIHLHSYYMLLKWRDSKGVSATLENLILKMRKAKGVTIDWKAIETVANEENNDQCDSGSSDDNYMGSDDEEAETNSGGDIQSDFKPRDYQLELAEHALKGKNTVICAVTGSGKTWVALHIVKEHLKGAPRGERKVAFMARTGILIQQQSSRFEKYLPDLNTKLLSAEDENTKFLDSFLEYYDIFCFTPQILVNSLQNMSVKSISQFSLLILDECHHTAGEEPYNNLMRRYLNEKIDGKTKLPQIIGLTATFGVGKSRTDQEAVDYILRLCARMDIRIISTVNKHIESLRKYTCTPSEEVILLDNQEYDPCKLILVQAIVETESKLQDITLLQCKMIDVMKKMPRNKESKEYVKWVNEVKMNAQKDMDFTSNSRDIIACTTYLNGYSEALEMNRLLHANDVIRHLAQTFGADAEQLQALTKVEEELLQSLKAKQKELIEVRGEKENRNILTLCDTLRKEFIDKGEDSRAMVFVKARVTCQALADFLNQDLEDIAVQVHSFYGQSTIGRCRGMTDKEQIELTERFREGYYKILVATSVGIEGIDVPDCNIILSYDYSGNELMKTQMKGRSRKAGGKAITMGSKKDKDQEVVNAYKAAMMQRAVKQFQALDRNSVNYKILSYQKEELNKYNSRVEMESAKLRKKTTDEYELRCIRCNSFACYAKDLIKYQHHHLVTEKEFDERIKKVPHVDQKLFDGIKKKYKMYCKDCPVPWGAVGYLHNIEVKILKLESFKCKCLDTGVISIHKKWKDTPFYVKEVKEADLHKYIKPGSGDVS